MSETSEQAGQMPSRRELLDVESPAERQERLGRLFTSQTPSATSSPLKLPPLRPDIGPVPQSDLLARVRDFLPLFASSNEDLLARAKANPDEVDIENTQGDDRVIEMDLGLGVFDVKGKAKGDMGPELDIPQEDAQRVHGREGERQSVDEDGEDVSGEEDSDDSSDTSSDDSGPDSGSSSN